jgi:pseudaminic acid biosynthesis-associated methylase
MTEQEKFWAGNFGDEYTGRNIGNKLIENNISLFSDILPKARGVKSILELGCNIGLNLAAIDYIDPSIVLTGIDINAKALAGLADMFDKLGKDQPYTFRSSIATFDTDERYDLVFTKGVLIHCNPDALGVIYDRLYTLSNRYILLCEYYNPTPMSIPYRGHDEKLYKRDFAGEMMDKYNLKLVSYGFRYHKDAFPADDITYFLLSKE